MQIITIYKCEYLWYRRLQVNCHKAHTLMPASMKSLVALLLGTALASTAFATPASAEELASYNLAARDGRFEPALIEVPAGKRFHLEVNNEGKSAIEFESHDLKQEKVIPSGKRARVTINALQPGEYRFFDDFHQKTGQGRLVAK